MLRTQYIVVEHDGAWKIRFEGRHFGPYANERTAVHVAIAAAERAPNSGSEPRVMVQSSLTGQLRVEWTYGDPHPADMPSRTAATPTPNQDAQNLRRTG
jgi:hypothetical protein